MSDRIETRKDHPRSSRNRDRGFVQGNTQGRLEDSEETGEDQKQRDGPGKVPGDGSPSASRRERHDKRRKHVREDLRWLRPHRYGDIMAFQWYTFERGNDVQLTSARGDYYRMVLRQMESHGHEGEEVWH